MTQRSEYILTSVGNACILHYRRSNAYLEGHWQPGNRNPQRRKSGLSAKNVRNSTQRIDQSTSGIAVLAVAFEATTGAIHGYRRHGHRVSSDKPVTTQPAAKRGG